ncbi:MAG: rRNA pseudouridine synthase [Anaerolineae bacterium]|nr:rRNA pseudouridine synthase [Anaerolineae bacterium]
MTEERVQKIMAQAGIASRRKCEEIIEQKRVTVNGKIATLGMKADASRDDIRVDGTRLQTPEMFDYIMLNKPRGVISDEDVGGNWPAARELIPIEGRLYPVGRLDVQSEGLLLFTNDGDLAHKLTHPRYEHPKIYRVLVAGNPTEKTLDAWRRGITLDGKRTLPCSIERVQKTKDGTWLEITLKEGRKRQIRRVASVLEHPALSIERTAIGPLKLGNLPSGGWRRLTEEEVSVLKKTLRQSRPPQKRQRRPPPQSNRQRKSSSSKKRN